jgi:hypothetical protein
MSGPITTYRFVAQDATTNDWVDLDIRESCDKSLQYFRSVWHKLTLATQNCCKLRDVRHPNWADWKPHEWSAKVEQYRLSFVAWDGDFLAGFLNLRTNFRSVVTDEPIIYVEHIAAFPGNQPTDLWERRLKGVGPALLAYAVQTGKQQGAARLGLHADAEAVGWYDQLDKKRGKVFEVRQMNVAGLYPVSASQVYFETSVHGAATLLDDYKDG